MSNIDLILKRDKALRQKVYKEVARVNGRYIRKGDILIVVLSFINNDNQENKYFIPVKFLKKEVSPIGDVVVQYENIEFNIPVNSSQDIKYIAELSTKDENFHSINLILDENNLSLKEQEFINAAEIVLSSQEEPQLNKINDKTTGEQLGVFAKSYDPVIRMVILSHPNVLQKTVNELSYDENPIIRYNAARNLKISASELNNLINDENPLVRYAVCNHPDVHHKTLTDACKDNNLSVRNSIVHHHNVNSSILEKMMDDNNASIRRMVKSRL